MHEFIEKLLPSGDYRVSVPVEGRITFPGKYIWYTRKEIKICQDMIVKNVNEWLYYNDAPEWAWSAFNFYKSQTSEVQMLINILLVLYFLGMQYYFFRHMVCESCFREWHKLNKDVEESGKNLEQRQKVFLEQKAKRQAELEQR